MMLSLFIAPRKALTWTKSKRSEPYLNLRIPSREVVYLEMVIRWDNSLQRGIERSTTGFLVGGNMAAESNQIIISRIHLNVLLHVKVGELDKWAIATAKQQNTD